VAGRKYIDRSSLAVDPSSLLDGHQPQFVFPGRQGQDEVDERVGTDFFEDRCRRLNVFGFGHDRDPATQEMGAWRRIADGVLVLGLQEEEEGQDTKHGRRLHRPYSSA